MTDTVQSLSEAQVGDQVEITELLGDHDTRWRLMDLGMVPGTTVEVLRSSPLGDPIVYRFRGTSVALRKQDAATVRVRRPAP